MEFTEALKIIEAAGLENGSEVIEAITERVSKVNGENKTLRSRARDAEDANSSVLKALGITSATEAEAAISKLKQGNGDDSEKDKTISRLERENGDLQSKIDGLKGEETTRNKREKVDKALRELKFFDDAVEAFAPGIANELSFDSTGELVAKDGSKLSEFVEAFAKGKERYINLEQKGGADGGSGGGKGTSKDGDLADKSVDSLLGMAISGE